MHDDEFSRSKYQYPITIHPRIYSIDRTIYSCNDLESYTKGILKYGRHKAIILEYKNQLLGHIKLSGYKTFLWYGLNTPDSTGRVYDITTGMWNWLGDTYLSLNDQGLAKTILRDTDPLGLRFSRSINREEYRTAVPEYLRGKLTSAQRQAINDNFHNDLSAFLSQINKEKLPIVDIPFKDIHYKKTLFYYLGLEQKPRHW